MIPIESSSSQEAVEEIPQPKKYTLLNMNKFKKKQSFAFASLLLVGSTHAAVWTPSETSTALWFDAADASTITESSGNVSQWSDKSGNGRDATQTGAGTAQPDTGGTHNGLNTINLDGTGEFFNLGTGLDWLAADATHTSFVILNVGGNYSNIYGAANGGAADASLHVGFASSTQYRQNRWSNDYNAPVNNLAAGEFNILRFSWVEGGAKSVHANTLLEGQSAPTHASGLSAMAGGGRIGNVVGQGFIGADIAEIIIVEGTPDADTTDRIEGYLAWKWGEEDKLPVGHAYEFEAPQIVPEPSSALLLGLSGLALLRRRRK